MEKKDKTVVILYNVVLFSSSEEWILDTPDLDESTGSYVAWKKAHPKSLQTVWVHLNRILKMTKWWKWRTDQWCRGSETGVVEKRVELYKDTTRHLVVTATVSVWTVPTAGSRGGILLQFHKYYPWGKLGKAHTGTFSIISHNGMLICLFYLKVCLIIKK